VRTTSLTKVETSADDPFAPKRTSNLEHSANDARRWGGSRRSSFALSCDIESGRFDRRQCYGDRRKRRGFVRGGAGRSFNRPFFFLASGGGVRNRLVELDLAVRELLGHPGQLHAQPAAKPAA